MPADRIGHGTFTLAVLVPFAMRRMGQPLRLDDLWAGLGSQRDPLPGAVCLIFGS